MTRKHFGIGSALWRCDSCKWISRPAHRAELVAHLLRLVATLADTDRDHEARNGQGDNNPGRDGAAWTVLADHEGNLFRVLEPRSMYRDAGPIAAVVVSCADLGAMAQFWGGAMDWNVHEVNEDFARLRSSQGVGPYLEFHREPDRTIQWGRVHLDRMPYQGDDQSAEVDRLKSLGATTADVGQGNVPWVCLADPEGNEFCVLTPG